MMGSVERFVGFVAQGGAGYVIHRAMKERGYECEVIAPSVIPKRSGVPRKHDKRDATDLARFYRAGELTAVRIPSETDERVRDVVRCRETFQKDPQVAPLHPQAVLRILTGER